MTTDRRFRCCFCGMVLPAWYPVPGSSDGAMLLNHMAHAHPAEVGTFLDQMHTTDDTRRPSCRPSRGSRGDDLRQEHPKDPGPRHHTAGVPHALEGDRLCRRRGVAGSQGADVIRQRIIQASPKVFPQSWHMAAAERRQQQAQQAKRGSGVHREEP
jgi:hypothetical protein